MEKTDHDILIRVEAKVESLTDEVRLMRDGVKEQITTLFATKVDKATFNAEIVPMKETLDKHDKQINRLLWLIGIGVGIVITLQFVALLIKG